MCALRTDYFPPSNRRRCVKSRPSYTEPADLLLSGTVHQDQSRDSFSQNEDSYINSVESDDGEEEPITIDLSAFLNENPLLAQSAFQSSSENNVAATESSSQFRVTDCEINTSEIPRTDVTIASPPCDVNEVNSADSGAVCENVIPVSPDYQTTLQNHAKENLPSPEKVLSDVINNGLVQSITLNGNKSPQKKFSRSKPLGFSNVLKKYKNFLKSKDLNKTNEKVFGKYPVVKCEKLDIENFVKNNKIKVCNWPLTSDNRINKTTAKKRTNLNKSTIKPKFIKKSISVNKFLINSNKTLTENANNSSLLSKQFAPVSSKPIIIRTNPWKPEVANASSSIPTFLKNFVKTPPPSPKSITSDLLKFRDENINCISASAPENEARKSILVNSVNKLSRSKNFTLIAPKPIVQSPELISSPPKPVTGILAEPIPFNYTVIEPYVEDPTSPQKPKPILTVPIEVLSPEKQTNDNNLAISTVHSVAENSGSLAKTGKSVFMNGKFKQITSPTRITKDICVTEKESNRRKANDLMKVNSKVSDVNKEDNSQFEENSNILKAKNVVVDAMQSAFSLTQKKKKVKPRTVRKESFNAVPEDPILGTTAFSSILNDNLFHGFSEDDFEDVSHLEDASFSSISHDSLTFPKENVLNQENVFAKNSDLTSINMKKARKRKKFRRKKSSLEESSFTSDTLSASECEVESNTEGKTSKKKKTSLETVVENIKSPPHISERNEESDSVKNTFVNHTDSKDVVSTDNKVFDSKQVDSSLPLCNLENHAITESINDQISSKINSQSETQETLINKTVNNVENSPDKKCNKVNNSLKPETCTRTLRERKCSSTEVDKLSDNSVKQSTHNKNLQEKCRVKGSINSKLKIQLKSPRNTNNGKRKSSKPEDIIQEIKTITGGLTKREFKKYKRSFSSKYRDSGIPNVKDESESNSSTSFSNSPSSCSFSKRKRTLKVCIKQSRKKKNASCLKMPLNSLSGVVENTNSTSSLSENNLNLHSSFREGKCEKMDSTQKEENSTENNTSLADSHMEVDADENCSHGDSVPANVGHPVVSSSTTLLQQDAVCAEIVSNAVSELNIMSENKENDSNSSSDVLKQVPKETENVSVENEENSVSLLSSNNESYEENTKENNTLSKNIEDSDKSALISLGDDSESLNNIEDSGKSALMSLGGDSESLSNIEDSGKSALMSLGGDSESLSNIEDSGKSTLMSLGGDSECNVANSESVSDNKISENKIPTTAGDNNNAVDSTVQDLTETIDVDIETILELSENVEKNCEILESKEKSLIDNVSVESTKDEKNNSSENENNSDISETPNVDACDKSENNCSDSELLLAPVSSPEEPLSEQKIQSKEGTFDFPADNPQTEENEVVSSNSLNIVDHVEAPILSNDVLKSIDQDSEKVNENEDEESINNACHSVILDLLSDIKNHKNIDIVEPYERTESESTFDNCSINNSKEIMDTTDIMDEQVTIKESIDEVKEAEARNTVLPSDEIVSEQSIDEVKEAESRNTVLASDEIVSEQSFTSPSKSSVTDKNEVSSSTTPKKCPKLKISYKKPDGDSPDSLKNWFVSVSKESEETELLDTTSDVSAKKDGDNLVVSENSANNENPLVDSVPCKVTPVQDDSSDLAEKIAIESVDETPVEKQEISLKCPIVIKEEPMDYVENDLNSEETRPLSSNQSAVSEKAGTVKRPRRSRKSADARSSDYEISEKVPRKVKLEVIDPVTPQPRGRKSQISPVLSAPKSSKISSSTPKTTPGRKKNYDPELVCVPFSMGWMREHVIRATGDGKASDVYYFAPDGKKLRSMPDILSYLSKHPHIKLSAENFTFAKELIYREPFEKERGAKQAPLKFSTTPKSAGKSPKKLKSSIKLELENSNLPTNESPSTDTKKNVKRKSSSASGIKTYSQESKNMKQKSLAEYLSENSEQSEDKLSRPSRKIVKKVPFDNSFEKNGHRKSKSETAVSQNSKDVIKIKIKKESVSNEEPKKKSVVSSLITVKSASRELKESEIKKSKPTVPENSVNKSPSVSNTEDVLLSRTSIKSPVIKNRLKVRLAPKKPGSSMHKPCTRFCNFAFIREPTVKCCICLCLFHAECIPFKQAGLTKYACVPCVVTQLDQYKDTEDEIFFPADFDIEMLYPKIDLELVTDPASIDTLNKTNSLVYFSPVSSSENKSASHPRPPLYTYSQQTTNYMYNQLPCSNEMRNIVNKYICSPSTPQVVPGQRNRMYYSPPVSFPVSSRTTHKDIQFRTLIPIQKCSNTVNQGASVANPGSLPLLQNFSNAFFVQSQPSNRPCTATPIIYKNAPGQFSNKPFFGLNVKAFNSHPQNSAIIYKSYPYPQQGNTQMNNSIQNTHGQVRSDPILSSILNKNNPSPTVVSVVSLAKSNSVSETNLKDSSTHTPDPAQVNVNNDKRKSNDDPVTKTKKIKSSQEIAENSAGSSSTPHKENTHLLDARSFNTFIQFYECLNFIFKFLNVCDLLRASMVSKSWKHLASQKLLWEKVSFAGIYIKDWNKCCRTLQKCETKSIDFRGMHGQDSIDEWKMFSENVHKLNEVEELIFEKVPPFVIVKIAQSLPRLKKLICYCLTSVFTEPEIWSTPCEFELAVLRGLGRIEVIKISSMGGIHLKDNPQSLMPYLPNLTHVVLTGFKFNSSLNLESLFNQQLIALELGDCTDIEPMIYSLLEKLTSLEKLCLQNGGSVTDEKLPAALLKMNKLKSLELMNYRVSCHLPDALTKMNILQHFSLWPDTSSEAAQVNFNSYKAATSCCNLKRLCWGILTDDDDTVPNELELKDSGDTSSEVRKLSFQELFQSLVKHYPGVKVEVKCLPRSIWTEFCSSRNVI